MNNDAVQLLDEIKFRNETTVNLLNISKSEIDRLKNEISVRNDKSTEEIQKCWEKCCSNHSFNESYLANHVKSLSASQRVPEINIVLSSLPFLASFIAIFNTWFNSDG